MSLAVRENPYHEQHDQDKTTIAILSTYPSINPFKPIKPHPPVSSVFRSDNGTTYMITTHKLGSGTTGTVYKAIYASQNIFREVAIKISQPNNTSYQTLCREEKFVAALNKYPQTSIVKFVEGFSANTSRYSVYELLSSDLFTLIKSKNALSWEEIRTLAKKLFKALVYLKLLKIIHGDIKPDNILSTTADRLDIRLCDFSRASSVEKLIHRVIQAPIYRAPEVALGLPYNAAADMWSVGCILAELRTKTPLFAVNGSDNIDEENRGILLEIARIVGLIPEMMLQMSQLSFNTASLKTIHSLNTNHLSHHLSKTKRPIQEEDGADVEDEKSPEEEAFLDLMKKIFTIDPAKRISPESAMQHHFIIGFPKVLEAAEQSPASDEALLTIVPQSAFIEADESKE